MFRNLFSFLFLLLLCCICRLAYAEGTGQTKRVELFAPGTTTIPFTETNSQVAQNNVKYFSSPYLASANGVMIAFADVTYNENDGNGNIGIVAKCIGTEGEDWAKNTTEDNGSKWKTQLVMPNDDQEDVVGSITNPMAVGTENKIYLLAVKSGKPKEKSHSPNESNLEFVLSVGEVTGNKAEPGTEKTINWNTPVPSLSTLTQQLKEKLLSVSPLRSYSAFLSDDGNIVFVMGAKKESNVVPVIIHSKGKGKETELELSYVGTDENCDSLFFFYWEGKLNMVSYYRNGSYNVRQSTDMGKTWRNVIGPVSRLWDNFQNAGNIITVTIDNNKKVLLFTERRNKGQGSQAIYENHLWMTDGKRLFDVESFASGHGAVGLSELLYTNGELFCLHQEYNIYSDSVNQPGNITITRLNDELEKIKSVLKTWEAKDESLSTPCSETTPQGTPCVTPMPTVGLVGFLSNTTSGDNNNIWVDEYFYVNATVKGGTKVDNGLTFSGTNSGAQWPVGLQEQSQRYNFSRYGLTVVATVTIHDVPESDSPLLTVNWVSNEEHVGLRYNKDKQWKLKSLKSETMSAGDWEANRTYHVALVLNNSNLSAYIDGNLGGSLLRRSTHEEGLFGIQHIFIGGYKDGSVEGTLDRLTVTNVFLYNRPLNATELETIGKRALHHLDPQDQSETTRPTDQSETTRPTDQSETTRPTDQSETTRPTDQSETTRPTDQSETTRPTDQSETTNPTDFVDSSVHMRVCTLLLFLLSLCCCAVFC